MRDNVPERDSVVRAVLFDVGGPIDREEMLERLIDAHIREALASLGIAVTDEQYADANRWAVESFAPNAYAAIIWRLAGADPALSAQAYDEGAGRDVERQTARGGIELRGGIPELLAKLQDRGLKLGLAANQHANVVARLEACGIVRYFDYLGVSGSHGLRKPDTRLFVHACEGLAVAPEECVMVGDRIDNDMAPARMLGMRTVLFRTGRHIEQQPRSWEEQPDVEVRTVGELTQAVAQLLP